MTDEVLADIRRWYHNHGTPFNDEDWGPRAENGESAGKQTQQPERASLGAGSSSVKSADPTPTNLWWWEKQHFPWHPRSEAEKEWVYLLDTFFAPYLAMLPRPKGNLVRQVFADLHTYAEVGATSGVSRQAAHEAVKRALRDLTRLIANDDPQFVPPADGRRRDYKAEVEAARRVFDNYLAEEV